jgi:hypothetical protein
MTRYAPTSPREGEDRRPQRCRAAFECGSMAPIKTTLNAAAAGGLISEPIIRFALIMRRANDLRRY